MLITVKDDPQTKVLWRGIDISNMCFAVDPDRGWVDIFVNDDKGHIVYSGLGDDIKILTARISGDIKIIQGEQ